MKQIAVLVILLSVINAKAYVYKLRIGNNGPEIIFAKSSVNGAVAWTQAEEDNLKTRFISHGGTATVTVVDISPPGYIVELSTTLCVLRDCENFEFTQSKLAARMEKIKQRTDFLIDMDDAKSAEANAQYKSLKAGFQLLPKK